MTLPSPAAIRLAPRGRVRPGSARRRRLPAAVGATPAGFTLLEIILALVILAAALATFGEIMQLANRNAVNARAETQAQILANSVMDELLAGAVEVVQTSRQPLPGADAIPWLYSVTVGTSDLAGVQPVEVTVEQDLEPQFNPVKFRLLRWLPLYLETPELTGGGGSGGPPS